MRRLGYQRYGVHGGDIGAGVSGMVAGLDGEHVTGVHVVTDPLTAANVATFLPGMADRLDENDPVDKLILDRMDAFTREGSGLPGDPEQPAADHRLRPGRLTAAAAGLDRGEVPRVDRPAGRPRPAAHHGQPVLVHRLRRQRRAHPVRAGALVRLGRAAGRTAGLRGLRRRRDGRASWSPRRPARTGPSSSAASISRRWRPRPAGRRPAGLLRAAAVTGAEGQVSAFLRVPRRRPGWGRVTGAAGR